MLANKVWVSDITFIWTREGWVYLAAILDIFNRKIVGWSMDDSLSHEILADALHKAIQAAETRIWPYVPFRSWDPVCQLCFSGAYGAIWFCSEHEFFRELLRQRPDGIIIWYGCQGCWLICFRKKLVLACTRESTLRKEVSIRNL